MFGPLQRLQLYTPKVLVCHRTGRTGQKEVKVDQFWLDGARVAVLESLHSRLTARTKTGIITERDPGSRASAIIERAIEYTLSPDRTESEAAFLQHGVLRNARLAVRRAADAEARVLADVAALVAPSHLAFSGRVDSSTYSSAMVNRPARPSSVHTNGPAGKVAGTATVASITPEDVAVASDLERRLRESVQAHLGLKAARVLDCMLDNDNVDEAATRLGVSDRTVKRARAKIRVIATALLRADEVAA